MMNPRPDTRPGLKARLRIWAQALARETYALYLAYRDPRVPWYARVWAAIVVAYALSPIDLIPDPIPVLGYLDDLLIVPAGIWVAVRLIPADVLAECRTRAATEAVGGLPASRGAAVAVIITWLAMAVVLAAILTEALR